ncbi:hypothetical protein RJ641_000166 [Dillenia turbinata]|uniref:Uncharacterized protein n=1 Tax=Dillenia turbinata TaxID=194707 RepID=A0AAN8WHN8_9MAGN
MGARELTIQVQRRNLANPTKRNQGENLVLILRVASLVVQIIVMEVIAMSRRGWKQRRKVGETCLVVEVRKKKGIRSRSRSCSHSRSPCRNPARSSYLGEDMTIENNSKHLRSVITVVKRRQQRERVE